MHPPDDLDDYLRGDSALSRQYRREVAPPPPHALDRRVLKFFREAHDARIARSGTPYLAPLACAASVLLSVALVLAIVFGPQAAKHIDDTPRIVRAAARTEAPSPRLYSSDPKLARTPSAWLGDIEALRRAGRNREADAEFRRFRSAYPDYSIGALDSQR